MFLTIVIAVPPSHSAPPPVPGSLPSAFVYRYSDSYRGWPVRVLALQHPIRGSFLDPRGPDNDALSGYHFGIDINVDDQYPDRHAPPGLSHRVFALESGTVTTPVNDPTRSCGSRRLDVGHFAYWHLSPTVRAGQRIRAGEPIGWTCLGEWHVHLSEWQRYRGRRVWVNPLHHAGKLLPFTDRTPPVVAELRFHTPPRSPWEPRIDLSTPDNSARLDPNNLHGLVEVRARAGDPQSFSGFLGSNSRWATLFHPYRLAITIRDATSNSMLLRRVAFQADQLPTTPYLVHYAPGTSQNASMQECVGPPRAPDCSGTDWFRPLSRDTLEYWDTRRFRNGSYRVIVTAWDIASNSGQRMELVRVRN